MAKLKAKASSKEQGNAAGKRAEAGSETSSGDKLLRINQTISIDEKRSMIAEAAYYLAVQRDFQGGSPEQDWYRAEVEIDRLLGASA